jgi:hypothetical protein
VKAKPINLEQTRPFVDDFSAKTAGFTLKKKRKSPRHPERSEGSPCSG